MAKLGTVHYETREVLAGSYVKESALLTHTVKFTDELRAEFPLCSKVKAGSIADRGSMGAAAREEAPTCSVCRRRDPRFTEPAGAPEPRLTVRVGAGLVEAMQLDDASVCDSYGLTYAYKGNRLDITATAENLRRFRAACNANSWNCDARYARSSSAAVKALAKAGY